MAARHTCVPRAPWATPDDGADAAALIAVRMTLDTGWPGSSRVGVTSTSILGEALVTWLPVDRIGLPGRVRLRSRSTGLAGSAQSESSPR